MTMLSTRHCEPLAAKQSREFTKTNYKDKQKKTEHHEKKL
jgi:hypothetical protein